jgi:hypothetical protein
MSFDKDYPNRKDWRKKYYRSGRFDRSCRCNGKCDYCRDNRLYSVNKAAKKMDDLFDEYLTKDKP